MQNLGLAIMFSVELEQEVAGEEEQEKVSTRNRGVFF
jgi:hypothetical protein